MGTVASHEEAATQAQRRERARLDAARSGDERAFVDLVAPYRRELHAHCYRMLGSVHDADEALQEALVRAWRGLPGFLGRSSLRTWLYKIATNASLRLLEQRSRRALPVDYGPAADPHDAEWRAVEAGWVEPYPSDRLYVDTGGAGPAARYERTESVELAFVAAVQHLPPNQRAVLLLREVLGFSAKETAAALETTVASVNSALQRARGTLRRRLPERSQQASLRALGDVGLRELVQGYVDAWERGDAAAILDLLAEDATFSMPPFAAWYRGREAIAAFLPRGPLRERWRLLPVRANAQPAFGCYRWNSDERSYVAHSIDVVTVAGRRIDQITAFLDAGSLADFGLPPRLHTGVAAAAP